MASPVSLSMSHYLTRGSLIFFIQRIDNLARPRLLEHRTVEGLFRTDNNTFAGDNPILLLTSQCNQVFQRIPKGCTFGNNWNHWNARCATEINNLGKVQVLPLNNVENVEQTEIQFTQTNWVLLNSRSNNFALNGDVTVAKSRPKLGLPTREKLASRI